MRSSVSINMDDISRPFDTVYGKWWCYYPTKPVTMSNPGYDFASDVVDVLSELDYTLEESEEDVERFGNIVDIYHFRRDQTVVEVTAYEQDSYTWTHVEIHGSGREAMEFRQKLKGF